ncbi:MAG: NACHT domain-containing protein, partial [Planctomycetota bacterium]|nr:NACHT domain-containing protein [Planctomycetota bacterium]
MAFDFNFWKAQIKEKLTGWKGSSDQLGSSFLYSFCASTTLWPLVDAVAGGNLAALGALFTTLQGVGGGLIANRINEWKNKSSVGELADELNRQIQDDDDLRNELDTLLEKLDTIELAKAGLEESDREWFEQTLRAELEQLGNLHRFEAHLSGTGAIAQSGAGPAVAAGEKGIAVGGDVKELHVHYGTEPPASNTDHPDSSVEQPAPASSVSHQPSTINHVPSAYLQWLADRLRYLDIRGMGINELTARFPLEEVYVDLKARAEIPPSDTNAELLRIGRRLDEDSLEKMRLAGRELTEEEVESMGRSVSLTAPLMDLFRNAEGLIILGDPGSGKTTFLKYLAMQLAEGHAGALGLENLLPILVPLSAYANALANGSGNGIKDFLVQYHIVEKGWEEEQGLKALFDEALDKGRALLLFDGLDEVRDDTQRKIVVERVTSFFSQHRQKGNRFVMTSRIVGYKEVRPQVEALQECTLLDFDEEEIESFADKWTGVLEKTVQGDTRSAAFDALKEKQELIDAVQRNEGVRRLAANPLLLTILALMKRQGITLPDRRVELYKIYVETLLKHWNAQREGAKDLLGTVKVLAPLAYWLQENSPGVGLARQEEVLAELARIYESRGSENPKDEAENLLDDVRTHTGLLLERGQGAYGFIHLTFQEYLAAVHVYLEGQGRPSEAVKILYEHLGDDNWHEVSLLAIGEVAINNKQERVAGDILEGLIRKCVQPARVPEGAILAGEAASDIGEDNIQMTSVDRVRETLTQCLLSSPLSPPPLSSSPLSPPPLSSSPLSP